MSTAGLEELIKKHGIPAHLIDKEDAEERWNTNTERDDLQYSYEFWEPWVKDLESDDATDKTDSIYGETTPIIRWPNANWQFNAECVTSAYALGLPLAVIMHEGLHYAIGLGAGVEVSGPHFDGLAVFVRAARHDNALDLIGVLAPGYVDAGIGGALLRGAKNASARAGMGLAFLANASAQLIPTGIQRLWTENPRPLSDTYTAAALIMKLPYSEAGVLTAVQMVLGATVLATAVVTAYRKEIYQKVATYVKNIFKNKDSQK
jgi:hypothetical protein